MAFSLALLISLINDKYWEAEKSWICSILQIALSMYFVKSVVDNTPSLVAQGVDL